MRSMLGVAVLSAVLASVATFGLMVGLGMGSQQGDRPISNANGPAAPAVSTRAGDIASVVAKAKESVVTITAQGISDSGFNPFNIPATGVGSGIVVGANDLILTNNHVVEGAQSLTVTTADGVELPATVVNTDQRSDIALIRASGSDLASAVLADSSQIQVGQSVLAIGSPLGEFTETVTRGIVSALDRSITVSDESGRGQKNLSGLIQTDAAINPGNSGGPLIDLAGNVVGMNTAVTRSAEGIGFAIPINAAKSLIDQALGSSS
jgi:S1-C subfamily serine protease